MDGRKARGKWGLAEGVSSRGGEATPVQLLEKADERRGEGVIAQFAPVHPLVLGAPHGVGLEFGGVDGNVKYLVGEPVLKAESCRRKAPPRVGELVLYPMGYRFGCLGAVTLKQRELIQSSPDVVSSSLFL